MTKRKLIILITLLFTLSVSSCTTPYPNTYDNGVSVKLEKQQPE
jgi:hypothetical protein